MARAIGGMRALRIPDRRNVFSRPDQLYRHFNFHPDSLQLLTIRPLVYCGSMTCNGEYAYSFHRKLIP